MLAGNFLSDEWRIDVIMTTRQHSAEMIENATWASATSLSSLSVKLALNAKVSQSVAWQYAFSLPTPEKLGDIEGDGLDGGSHGVNILRRRAREVQLCASSQHFHAPYGSLPTPTTRERYHIMSGEKSVSTYGSTGSYR